MFYRNPTPEFWDTALVCLNGHVINGRATSRPEFNQKHCSKCGELATETCPSCNAKIKGIYVVPGVFNPMKEPPSFCDQCGKPFPWTEQKLSAAKDVAALLEGLSDDEKFQLQGTLDDLVKEGPKAEPAKLRFKQIMKKAGHGSLETMKDVLSGVLSETIKKSIFGG